PSHFHGPRSGPLEVRAARQPMLRMAREDMRASDGIKSRPRPYSALLRSRGGFSLARQIRQRLVPVVLLAVEVQDLLKQLQPLLQLPPGNCAVNLSVV